MTVTEANNIIRNYERKGVTTESDDFLYTEALSFVIAETGDPGYMMALGGWYYEQRKFDLALKYYDMAAACDYEPAYGCLGYIWYYGRTGEKDYEKAFRNFQRSAELGNRESAYKVADMYKNGYYVEKNVEKYREIIEDLYKKVKNERNLFAPVPQICMRLARIRTDEGRAGEAVELYLHAKDYLAQRLAVNSFFGDITNMLWLTKDLFSLVEFPYENFDFYDMMHLLSRADKRITFRYAGRTHEVRTAAEEGAVVLCFDGKWFRKPEDFYGKAAIGDKKLTQIYRYLYDFEVQDVHG